MLSEVIFFPFSNLAVEIKYNLSNFTRKNARWIKYETQILT